MIITRRGEIVFHGSEGVVLSARIEAPSLIKVKKELVLLVERELLRSQVIWDLFSDISDPERLLLKFSRALYMVTNESRGASFHIIPVGKGNASLTFEEVLSPGKSLASSRLTTRVTYHYGAL